MTRKIGFTGLFFLVWMVCIGVFGLTLALGTDFFNNMVTETTFGNSKMFTWGMGVSVFVGILSFICGVGFFVITRIIKNTFLRTVVITISLLIFAFCGGYAYSYISGSISQISKPGSTSVVTLQATSTPASTLAPTLAPTPRPRVLDGGKLFNLVNKYRSDHGLPQLQWFHPLCEYSKKRSQEATTDWSHTGFNEDSKTGLLWQYCPDCIRVGENLAEGYSSEEAILQGWINSPSHKANLDGDWTNACSYFYGNKYVSMIFGKN